MSQPPNDVERLRQHIASIDARRNAGQTIPPTEIDAVTAEMKRLQAVLPRTQAHMMTPSEQLAEQIAGFRRDGSFAAIKHSLEASDSNHDGKLSYAECRDMHLNAQLQGIVAPLQAEIIRAYDSSHVSWFLIDIAASHEISKVNVVLSHEGLPQLDQNFASDLIRNHTAVPRSR